MACDPRLPASRLPLAWLAVLSLLTLGVPSSPLAGEAIAVLPRVDARAPAPAPTPAPTRAPTGDAPSIEDAVLAWTTARGWLDRLELPRVDSKDAALAMPRVHGISVILRVGGRVVGRGEHIGVDGLGLRLAMGKALTDLFSDESMARVAEFEGAPLGPRLTLEIEVAGEPTPLLGSTFAEVTARLEPGIDGVALRRGDQMAMAFPGRLLASNTAGNPVSVFGALSTELGLGLRDLPELRRTDAVEVYSLPVTRLVQPREGDLPILPMRGALLVSARDVTPHALRDALEGMVARAIQQRYRGPIGGASEVTLFRGDYRPVADQSRPPLATNFEQALMAFALWHAADGTLEPRSAHEAASAARTTLLALRRAASSADLEGDTDGAIGPIEAEEVDVDVDAGWIASLDARALAMATLAATVAPAPADVSGQAIAEPIDAIQDRRVAALQQMLESRLRSLIAADGVLTLVDDAGAQRVATGHDQALAAAALAEIARRDDSEESAALAARAADAAWRSVPVAMQATLLPWIAFAERSLAETGLSRDHLPMVRLREALLAAQVGFNDLGMAADLHGGLALAGAGLVPTAQSLRPMVGLAIFAADDHITPEPVRAVMWTRQVALSRFLLQLMVRPPMDGLFRNAARTSYGVRASLWDSDQPVAAQAIGILAVVETLAAWPEEDATGDRRP